MLRYFGFALTISILLLVSCKTEERPQESQKIEVAKPHTPSAEKPKDDRFTWQKPELVIQKLGNISDKTIADLGAGIGYFSFKLLPKAEKIIAIDIDKEAVQILNGFKNSLDQSLKDKLDVRLATTTSPGLNEKEVDIIFIVNTITYIDNRAAYLQNLKKYLKEDGVIFIVDYKSKRIPEFTEAPSMGSRLYMNVLEDELESAGYKAISTDDTTLDYQYITVASN